MHEIKKKEAAPDSCRQWRRTAENLGMAVRAGSKSFEEQCKSLWCSKESKRKQMLMKLKLSLTLTNFVMLVCSLNK